MFQWLRRAMGGSPSSREELFPPGIPREILRLLQGSEPTEEQGSCLLASSHALKLTLHWIGLKPSGELLSFSCGAQLLKVRLNYSGREHFAVDTSYVPCLDPDGLKQGLPLRLKPHGEAWSVEHEVDRSRWTLLARPEQGTLDLDIAAL